MTGVASGRQPVSVITIVRDRHDHLRHVTAALAHWRGGRPLEFVVVDMGSTPPVPDDDPLAGGLDRRVVRRAFTGALPLAAARNLGADHATHDRLVFLDVDCIPAPDLVDMYAAAPPTALTVGPVRYLRRHWARIASPVDPDALDAASAEHPTRPAPFRSRTDHDHERFWSLSFSVTRPVWERIGGFDEGYVGYGAEDTDFGFRARALGVPLHWTPRGTAFHQWHPVSTPPVEHLPTIVPNARRFRSIWGRWPMEGWLREFATLGLVEWEPEGERLELSV